MKNRVYAMLISAFMCVSLIAVLFTAQGCMKKDPKDRLRFVQFYDPAVTNMPEDGACS